MGHHLVTLVFHLLKKLRINHWRKVFGHRHMICLASPWFIFYDQALAPSWYNFTSYQMVREPGRWEAAVVRLLLVKRWVHQALQTPTPKTKLEHGKRVKSKSDAACKKIVNQVSTKYILKKSKNRISYRWVGRWWCRAGDWGETNGTYLKRTKKQDNWLMVSNMCVFCSIHCSIQYGFFL